MVRLLRMELLFFVSGHHLTRVSFKVIKERIQTTTGIGGAR